jgi:succinate dehydrogenase/fumarate reductase flavoprotein subunit
LLKKVGEILSCLESLGKIISTDILIIGGGIAGLTAAISAKETAPELDVLIVDKATASKGWAGKGPRTAGLISFVTPEDDPEEFVKYCVYNIGYFLNDQILLREFAYKSRQIVDNLSLWGVDVTRDPDGRVQYAKWPFPWGTAGIDPDMCNYMSRYAKNIGIKFIDKVCVADLLKYKDQVSGAVGFSLLDGTYYIFKARAVVLANGSQNYDITRVWCGMGNGIAAAYLVGAEMRNAEFGNMCDFARINSDGIIYYGEAHTAHDYLYNAKGENISQKYRPGLHSSMDPLAAFAWYKETLAGNGPIYADLEAFQKESGRYFKFHPKVLTRRHGRPGQAAAKRCEVVPGFIGELSCVKVDHQMATNISGLFAVGDVSGGGSARAGAVSVPPAKIHGTGILNALFMGMKGGPSAAIYAKALRSCGVEPEVDYEQARELKEKIYAPIRRDDGVSPREFIRQIQDAVAPVDYSLIKSEERMKEALGKVLDVQAKLEKMKAKDYHELAKCMDAFSMALCAEIFYKASLMRTESRGFHLREDYPEMDNKNWLKWIIVKKENETMKLYTEDVPIHKYPYRPFQ